jgi:hypothetical protein
MQVTDELPPPWVAARLMPVPAASTPTVAEISTALPDIFRPVRGGPPRRYFLFMASNPSFGELLGATDYGPGTRTSSTFC